MCESTGIDFLKKFYIMCKDINFFLKKLYYKPQHYDHNKTTQNYPFND